jgi:hypothetical protein
MSRIRVTIDRVALKGFEPAERIAILDGLTTELQRVLANSATHGQWSPRRTPIVRLHVPHQPGPSSSRALGGSVARAIGRSVKP